MTPVEAVFGLVLLEVVHVGANAVPRVQRIFLRGGVARFCAFPRCFFGSWL